MTETLKVKRHTAPPKRRGFEYATLDPRKHVKMPKPTTLELELWDCDLALTEIETNENIDAVRDKLFEIISDLTERRTRMFLRRLTLMRSPKLLAEHYEHFEARLAERRSKLTGQEAA